MIRFTDYLLSEGVLEKETTQLSRAVISAFKKHYPKAWKGGAQGAILLQKGNTMLLQRYQQRRLVATWADLELPEDFPIKNVMVYIAPGEKSSAGGRYSRKDDFLGVQAFVKMDGDQPDINDMIPHLKGLIRHELEHSSQDSPNPSGVMWNKLDSVLNYFTDPTETPAWVAGIYKQAKTSGLPFSKVVDYYMDKWREMMADYHSDAAIQDVLEQIRANWMAEAKRRFPKAQHITKMPQFVQPDEREFG